MPAFTYLMHGKNGILRKKQMRTDRILECDFEKTLLYL